VTALPSTLRTVDMTRWLH